MALLLAIAAAAFVAGAVLGRLSGRRPKMRAPTEAELAVAMNVAHTAHERHVARQPMKFPAHLSLHSRLSHLERELHRRGFTHVPIDLAERVRNHR